MILPCPQGVECTCSSGSRRIFEVPSNPAHSGVLCHPHPQTFSWLPDLEFSSLYFVPERSWGRMSAIPPFESMEKKRIPPEQLESFQDLLASLCQDLLELGIPGAEAVGNCC